MNKKPIFYATALATVAILIFGISSVYAQGPNRGNGNTTGTPNPYTCGGAQMQQGNANNHRGSGMMGSGMMGGSMMGNQPCGQMGGMMNHMHQGAWMGMNGMGMEMDDANFAAMLPPASATPLPQSVVDLMIAAWNDEQQAYATYAAVIAQVGQVAPFVNIQNAEAHHIAAWEFLFTRYGITVPEKPTAPTLKVTTLAQACQAGTQAETANVKLYDDMLTSFAAYPDLLQVAQMLRNASQFHHLPALQSCAG